MSSIFMVKSLIFPCSLSSSVPRFSVLKHTKVCLTPSSAATLFPSSRKTFFSHFKPFSLPKSCLDCPANPVAEVQPSPDPHMETCPVSGEIHVIVGPMFAGKTTALLRWVQAEADNGRSVAMIKSSKDTRNELNSIVTHDGAKMSCWSLSDLSTFRTKLGANEYNKLDVIGIDEAQFFQDLYDFCRMVADHDGKTVIVAGLDGDYLRRSFGSVLDIIPIADSVTKLMARCELCGKPAFFTLRKTEETQTELVGGADVYMPVCRQHYVNGQVVIEAARNVLESQKIRCDTYLETAPVYI